MTRSKGWQHVTDNNGLSMTLSLYFMHMLNEILGGLCLVCKLCIIVLVR